MHAKENIDLLHLFGHLDDSAKPDEVMAYFRPRLVKRNTLLLHEGAACRELYYVRKGCIRIYFIDKSGYEKTSLVLLDGQVGTAMTSFLSQMPSIEFIEALEDSELGVIDRAELFRLTEEVPAWACFYQKFLEATFLRQSRKIEALMTLDAKQRLQKLLKGNPALIQRVSNKVLASFLDVREETLSRIKSKK